ncbi:hypothetical protein M231_06580 [Tremella mesenterica]|uniref:Uncharacterized protein n=1 Tax=Tremella mesenterica TaxID=5217 RepID=A0A4Q1BF28_TREME|nr:hypothetical protein M231_06580 [Tremella mesenterica]
MPYYTTTYTPRRRSSNWWSCLFCISDPYYPPPNHNPYAPRQTMLNPSYPPYYYNLPVYNEPMQGSNRWKKTQPGVVDPGGRGGYSPYSTREDEKRVRWGGTSVRRFYS